MNDPLVFAVDENERAFLHRFAIIVVNDPVRDPWQLEYAK
jgi:hypothetical protein